MVRDQGTIAHGVLGESMRLSIITPVLNSHEVVRRQLLHYGAMHLGSDVEIIFVDDGSDPPLSSCNFPALPNFTIIETHDQRAWTWALARKDRKSVV